MDEIDTNENAVGFVSYEWRGAPKGVIDAYSGGTALIGIDEILRFFNRKQAGSLSNASYEIPVETGKGSWVAWILGVLTLPAATFAIAYAKKTGEKMAERDFSEIGFKDIAKKSIDALEKFIELVKHTKKLSDWSTDNAVWKDNSSIIGFPNEDGELIFIPSEYLKWYWDLPKGALKKLVAPIVNGRHMIVGVSIDNGKFRTVDVHANDIAPFIGIDDAESDDFIFPDLVHDQDVVLEGVITRGNQQTNSVGFQYQDHILNCIPENGSIRKFKPAMFLHCRIKATVNRHVGSNVQLDRRPTLIISNIITMESDDQRSLFE